MAIDLNELATAIGQLVLRFRMRRDTAAGWTSANPVLLSAEEGYETDTKKRKIGDGTTAWTSLAYDGGGSSITLVAGTNITIDNTDPTHPIISASSTGSTSGLPGPDIPPTFPTAWDDEFDHGTSMDTTGARRSGANAWVKHELSGTTGVDTITQSVLHAVYATGNGNRVWLQTAPSGDFTLTMKAKYLGGTSTEAPCLALYNNSTGKVVMMQLFSSPTLAVQRGTLNTTSFVYTFSSNPFTASTIPAGTWVYLRIVVTTSGTPTLSFQTSLTGYDFDFVQVYSETIAAWVGSITDVGLFENSPVNGIVEFFRRTA